MVVPFAAGGSTDVVARIIAQKMSEGLGQQVIVENVAGAGGSTGAARVAKADPDGYTILMGTVATHALNPLMLKRKPYDAVTDFAPVSLLVLVPNVLVVNPSVPAKTVPELIALLKADPAKYNYASSGVGTPLHLSGELFKNMAGVSMQHIAYRGAGPALNDLVGRPGADHVRQPAVVLGVHPGRHAAGIAVTTKERAPSFPDMPTIAEGGPAGLRDLHLERPVRSRRHPEGGRRPAERRGAQGGEGRRRAGEAEDLQRHRGRLDPGGPRRARQGRDREVDPGRQGSRRPDGVIARANAGSSEQNPRRGEPADCIRAGFHFSARQAASRSASCVPLGKLPDDEIEGHADGAVAWTVGAGR